jgi:hypothetical protein
MSAVSDFLKKHKITLGVVGTTLVLGTAYGSCQMTPSRPVEDVPAQEEAPVEEEATEAPAEEATPAVPE